MLERLGGGGFGFVEAPLPMTQAREAVEREAQRGPVRDIARDLHAVEEQRLGLVDGSTLLQPSGTALTNGGTVAAVSGDNEIEVAVQNQGTADESNINVDVSSDSGIVASTPSPPTRCGSASVTPSQSGSPEIGEQMVRTARWSCRSTSTMRATALPMP